MPFTVLVIQWQMCLLCAITVRYFSRKNPAHLQTELHNVLQTLHCAISIYFRNDKLKQNIVYCQFNIG